MSDPVTELVKANLKQLRLPAMARSWSSCRARRRPRTGTTSSTCCG